MVIYEVESAVKRCKASKGAWSKILRLTTLIWLLFILYLSHCTGSTTARQSRELSRLTCINEQMLRGSAHVVVYVVLGALVRLAWLSAPTVIIILAVVAIGILDEWSKQYVSGRHCSLKEMGLNVVGAVLGVLLAMTLTIKELR